MTNPLIRVRGAVSPVFGAFALILGLIVLPAAPVAAQSVTAHKQAIAQAASDDQDIADFYRDAGYAPLWTGPDAVHRDRRAALVAALEQSERHGLPARQYDLNGLMTQMRAARTVEQLGEIEVALTETFLRYARDVQTGILVPSRVDSGIVRQVPYRDRLSYLKGIAGDNPAAFLRALPPQTHEYTRLMKRKLIMQQVVSAGDWGPRVEAEILRPGDTGDAVIALRNRLIAMGYLERSAAPGYDAGIQRAVQRFQLAHGLKSDGVAGEDTLAQINVSALQRLQSIVVAMERERWLNRERGDRHILVNLTDFSARILDDDVITFQTRSVIGKNTPDRRTPEFSDVMDHMVINPSWFVPRSIATKEYLPALQRNRNAVSHLEITDRSGRPINRSAVDFSRYTARSFPFSMRQPPSQTNALGLVKFMFPNKYNIYLHDTPEKQLFSRETRAYSHGCIRLADPFDFAYALLAPQTDDPKRYFHDILETGRETRVNLADPVPVHLIYRTAFTDARGEIQYRPDVYGRDALIWDALERAGVALTDIQG